MFTYVRKMWPIWVIPEPQGSKSAEAALSRMSPLPAQIEEDRREKHLSANRTLLGQRWPSSAKNRMLLKLLPADGRAPPGAARCERAWFMRLLSFSNHQIKSRAVTWNRSQSPLSEYCWHLKENSRRWPGSDSKKYL